MMDYIGIDIGGTAVKIGLIDENGTVLKYNQYSVDFDGYETPILETVQKSLETFLEDFSINLDRIKGIGVSATGQVDSYSGIIIGTAGHIKNWIGSRIKEVLTLKFQLPVTVMNDANCAALAEKWIGAAKEVSDAIVVTIGTGVGGGILINSKILNGVNGLAGELGHFTIDCHGTSCTCGNTGCYEQYASTAALVRSFSEALNKGLFGATDFKGCPINGKTIFGLLADRNPMAEELFEKWLDYVATGLVNLVHIFNPQLILIGGGISIQDKLFILPLREKVLKRIMPAFGKDLDLKAAALGNDAGMIGAVYNCINHS
ncbi:ROK family protein [Anaerocolumna sp. AGMB13025]|uniref:ROK family protein n=1 Tax=Anaerocolumna sp. AGMB13025 TaxID=3039116 RepID=UPI00241EA3BC|nr:ROK family protein [Anaerocolumna sp. AGMB13025]WFR55108.1 ROK family protein [Anaerocolumna sp. AGMB13025]